MSDEAKLKPCPFCGAAGHIQREHPTMFIHCMGRDCTCSIGEKYDRDGFPDHCFYEEDAAIAAWNTRVKP